MAYHSLGLFLQQYNTQNGDVTFYSFRLKITSIDLLQINSAGDHLLISP